MSSTVLIKEFILFGIKQAYASIFGGFLLLIMIITHYWYPLESIHRYDFIFIAAIVFQLFLIFFKLETIREAIVIIVFHHKKVSLRHPVQNQYLLRRANFPVPY